MTKSGRLPSRITLIATGAAAFLLFNGSISAQGTAEPSAASTQGPVQPPVPTEPPQPADPNAPPAPAPAPNAPVPDPNAPPAPAEPPAQEQTNDLLTAASRDGRISTLVRAIRAAGLGELLSDKNGGPYTVFAPVNTAFTRLPNGQMDSLLKPENKAQLTNLLKNHIVTGRLTRADLLKMKEGDELTTLAGTKLKIGPLVRRTPSISGASIVSADALASNGVLHLINAVLVPAVGAPANPPGSNPPPAPPPGDAPHPGPPPQP